jgi:type IV pilus assembly protein PilB
MQNLKSSNIEKILKEAGLINDEKLKEFSSIQASTGENAEKLILSGEFINRKELLNNMAKKMSVELIDLENITVNKNAINYLKDEVVKKYNVFPFDFRNNYLYVAMQNPDDIFIIDEIKVFAQVEIKPFLADKKLISDAISYFYSMKVDNYNSLNITNPDYIKNEFNNKKVYNCEQEQISVFEEGHLNNIDGCMRKIIINAIKNNATDIHLDIYGGQPRIRYRIEGVLVNEESIYVENFEFLVSKIKVMSGIFTNDGSTPQKGHISYEIGKKDKLNLDVYTLPTFRGEKLLIKMEKDRQLFTLETLGLIQYEKDILRGVFEKKSGLIIVTGLAGSGRTATCYALIREILSNEINIITIENRVSEKIDGVSQIQVASKHEDAINNLFKSVVEHDPDVILVDLEINIQTLKYLFNTALGGKLVIVTMLYKNVYETITGLLTLGLEPYIIASAVEAIIAQYMVRKLCSKCKKKGAEISGNEDKKPIGNCNTCNGKGYKGKTGIFEVFYMNDGNRKVISKYNYNNMGLLEKHIDEGESTLYKSCIRLVTEGVISIDEIVRLSSDIRRI